MVCATARRAPMRAYFELDAQPDQRIEYTPRLERARIRRRPRFTSNRVWGRGRGVQIVRARRRAIIGIIKNRVGEAVVGRRGSLINSFTPSAMG